MYEATLLGPVIYSILCVFFGIDMLDDSPTISSFRSADPVPRTP